MSILVMFCYLAAAVFVMWGIVNRDFISLFAGATLGFVTWLVYNNLV